MPRGTLATARRLERATGPLAAAALERMDATLPWFRALGADERSWIGLVAQAGVAAFVDWFRRPASARTITAEVFGTAPRALTRAVSLQQTVEMVRVTIEVVEEQADRLAAPGQEAALREAVLRYSREVAFAAAQVYAQAAEARGAWDARLEALVVDALLRGEVDHAVQSHASALGWGSPSSVAVLVGSAPDGEPDVVVDALARAARHAHLDVLTGVHGDRLITVLGGARDPMLEARRLAPQFGPGPLVVGPAVADLAAAAQSASAALAGHRAAAGWPGAPRPVAADDLLPERALDGDPAARDALVTLVYRPLTGAGGSLLETAAAVLEETGSLEAAARRLFVHPNTVRYRVRRVSEVTGVPVSEPRGAFTLRVALVVGRLQDRGHPGAGL